MSHVTYDMGREQRRSDIQQCENDWTIVWYMRFLFVI